MTNQQGADVLGAAILEIQNVRDALLGPSTPGAITTPAMLDAALSVASDGAVLLVDPTLVYPAPFHLTKNVTLWSASSTVDRMTADRPAPKFTGGATLSLGRTLGMEITKSTSHDTDIVVVDGPKVTIAGCRILGDAVEGAKRGIAANGPDCHIHANYIDRIFHRAQETQAICAWNDCRGLRIGNNYLRAASEGVMIGGADAHDLASTPGDVMLIGNVITKDPAWVGKGFVVKTGIEIKNCSGFIIMDNDVSYCWQDGQVGYILQLTVRNQDGGNSWATVENGLILSNRFSHAASCVNILGLDDTPGRLSRRMRNVTMAFNEFTDIDPKVWPGSSKMVQMGGAPSGFTFDGNTVQGANFSSSLYFTPKGTPKAKNLQWTNNVYPKSAYGIFADNGTVGASWPLYTDGGSTLDNNAETNP